METIVRLYDNGNERVLGRANNQTHVVGPTQEWRCARTTSKGTFTKSEVNSYSCSWSIKKDCIWG